MDKNSDVSDTLDTLVVVGEREEFGESNAFCKKITHNADDPKSVLSQFRNDYHPRIAVTVAAAVPLLPSPTESVAASAMGAINRPKPSPAMAR